MPLSPDTAEAPVGPSVHIIWPAPGAHDSGPSAADLDWASTNAARTEVTEESTEATSPNLDCAAGTWRVGRTLLGRTSPLRLSGLLPGHCYRYTVTARSATGQVATARSGTLWVYPTWQGGLDLYRRGVFATQQTIDWCVPASVEMVLNIVDGRSIESRTEQGAFYAYGRTQNYTDYPIPGLDPKAATALLARAGQTYGDYRGASLDRMEREAVRAMRRTGKPVILYVWAGIHAWVLDGFTASADPAVTDAFTITSFSVMGPLWPTHQYTHGYYDMPPDTKLSPATFAGAVGGPYHERTARVPWEGTWVITEPR